MFIFAGQKNTLLHISVNMAGMGNKTDKLMRMYGQYSTYFGVMRHSKKKRQNCYSTFLRWKRNSKHTLSYNLIEEKIRFELSREIFKEITTSFCSFRQLFRSLIAQKKDTRIINLFNLKYMDIYLLIGSIQITLAAFQLKLDHFTKPANRESQIELNGFYISIKNRRLTIYASIGK